jgi:hypothetical protein
MEKLTLPPLEMGGRENICGKSCGKIAVRKLVGRKEILTNIIKLMMSAINKFFNSPFKIVLNSHVFD